MKNFLIFTALLSASSQTSQSFAEEAISVVGSSTVYPFATVVAERFGKSTRFKSPKIESTGSGSGMKLFCKGIGIATPTISNASRRIKRGEFDQCVKNGVSDILEVLIGYDGIVVSNAVGAQKFSLTTKDLYLALAKQVPNSEGKLIANPYKTWNQVNSELPNQKIEVYGPPPTSGTRDAFVELVLEGGAKQMESIKELKSLTQKDGLKIEQIAKALGVETTWAAIKLKRGVSAKGKHLLKIVSHSVREDGAYVELGENDNLIVNKLKANPNALGIFGFSFLDQNGDSVQAATINGQEATFDSIASGSYPVSRPLYFYVKKAHIGTIAGVQEYVNLFVSEDTIGEDGILVDKGLIPLSSKKFESMHANTRAGTALQL